MNRKWAAGFTRTQRRYQVFCVISFNEGPRTTHRVVIYACISQLFSAASLLSTRGTYYDIIGLSYSF